MTRHNDVPAGGDSEEPEATTALEGAALNLMFVRAALRRKRWLWMGTARTGTDLGRWDEPSSASQIQRGVKDKHGAVVELPPRTSPSPTMSAF